MPELPEVETIARGLAKRVTGDVIESVWIGERKQPLLSSAREIAATLEGSRLAKIRRVGKHIAIDLERDGRKRAPEHAQWIVHLGMTGKVIVADSDQQVEKHTHLIAKLASGRELRYVDPRMFGKLKVVREAFQAPGREPLEIGFEDFAKLFHGRKTPIKSALSESEITQWRGKYLRRRIAGESGDSAETPSCGSNPCGTCASYTTGCSRYCTRRLPRADRRSTTTSIPTATKASSRYSIVCMGEKGSRA